MQHLKILVTLVLVALSNFSYAQCGGPVPMLCDADGNRNVNLADISAISAARGTLVAPGDVRDFDSDGQITVLDSRQCVTRCTLPGCVEPCSRAADQASRIATAQALVTLNASNYLSRINYWAADVVYKEPVWTNTGRAELLDYLSAVFAGTAYGFPADRHVVIKDEVYKTHPDDSMTYMATVEWSGTFGTEYFTQTGMSILKFRPGEGCPNYHRDYSTEGDTWWNIPAEKGDVNAFRGVYIDLFELTDRCFDEDGDGYTKYAAATGCPNPGLDCNDFVPGINPGAVEILGDGIDQDCNPLTPDM
jgi:Putative metal-binding motif